MKDVKLGGKIYKEIERVTLFDASGNPAPFVDPSASDISAEKMLLGTKAFDANGNVVEGTIEPYTEETDLQINSSDGITIKAKEKYFEEDVTVSPILQEKTITENGEITADEGFAGLKKVDVRVSSNGVSASSKATGYTVEVIEGRAQSSVQIPVISFSSIAVGTNESA